MPVAAIVIKKILACITITIACFGCGPSLRINLPRQKRTSVRVSVEVREFMGIPFTTYHLEY